MNLPFEKLTTAQCRTCLEKSGKSSKGLNTAYEKPVALISYD